MGTVKDIDRRGSRRIARHELPQGIGVRIASHDAELINLSRGGILFGCALALRPGGHSQVDIVLPNMSRRLRGRIVRSHLTALAPLGPWYQVAMQFSAPIDFLDDEILPKPIVFDPFAEAVGPGLPLVAAADPALHLNDW